MNRKGSKLKGPRFRWDDEKLNRLKIRINAGMSRQEIAKEFGLPKYSIDHGVTFYGLTREAKRGPRIRQCTHEPRRIAALPSSDIPWPTPAQLMGRR